MGEGPTGCAGERAQSVAGHAIPHTRAHMHTHKHAHTYTQIDSRSFASKKPLTANRTPAKTLVGRDVMGYSESLLEDAAQTTEKATTAILYTRELVLVFTDRRAAHYKHPCRRRFLCLDLPTSRTGTSLTNS